MSASDAADHRSRDWCCASPARPSCARRPLPSRASRALGLPPSARHPVRALRWSSWCSARLAVVRPRAPPPLRVAVLYAAVRGRAPGCSHAAAPAAAASASATSPASWFGSRRSARRWRSWRSPPRCGARTASAGCSGTALGPAADADPRDRRRRVRDRGRVHRAAARVGSVERAMSVARAPCRPRSARCSSGACRAAAPSPARRSRVRRSRSRRSAISCGPAPRGP